MGEILGFLPDIDHHQNDHWYIVNVISGVTEQRGTCRPRFFNTMRAR